MTALWDPAGADRVKPFKKIQFLLPSKIRKIVRSMFFWDKIATFECCKTVLC